MKSSSSKNMNISCIKRHHLSNSNAFDTEINVIIESCRQRGFWGFLKKTGGDFPPFKREFPAALV